ncbi:hypothetical protein PNI0008_00676 [Streptococcus pneumoniae PNI0008]|nr:hypothetical protein PNI0008_00676 [Streptococcus pneumoniae PNI0008]
MIHPIRNIFYFHFSPFELIAKETVLFSYSFPFIYIIRNEK